MCNNVPCSPFSTRLSGSAKEVELRIRSIFQWKKQRPPLWAMVLTALAILSCGSLVSCQVREAGEESPAPAVEEPPAPTVEEPPAPNKADPPAGPEFTLTGEGAETVPFENLLGYGGAVTHSNFGYGWEQYLYQLTLPDGKTCTLADHGGPVFHQDVDGDGQLELICGGAAGLLTVFQRWPDGSIRSRELSQTAASLLGLEGESWRLVGLTFHPEDQTVTVQPTSGREAVIFPLSQLLDATHTGEIILPADQQPLDEGTYITFRDQLNLDGQGDGDDSAVVTSRRVDNIYGGQTDLEVTLGSGETLSWSLEQGAYRPILSPAFLTSPDHQCLVLELDHRTSNYGGAIYFVLEAADGQLEERFSLDWENRDAFLAIDGAYVQSGADGLQQLRLPDLEDKWHNPVWHTLSWSEAEQQLRLVSDGHFTDTLEITVEENRVLTLALRGRRFVDHSSRYQFSYLYYDQIEVWGENLLLQTIPPEFPLPASNAVSYTHLAGCATTTLSTSTSTTGSTTRWSGPRCCWTLWPGPSPSPCPSTPRSVPSWTTSRSSSSAWCCAARRRSFSTFNSTWRSTGRSCCNSFPPPRPPDRRPLFYFPIHSVT